MAKGVPFVQITMLFMQTTFKYCAKYTIIQMLEEIKLSTMHGTSRTRMTRYRKNEISFTGACDGLTERSLPCQKLRRGLYD